MFTIERITFIGAMKSTQTCLASVGRVGNLGVQQHIEPVGISTIEEIPFLKEWFTSLAAERQQVSDGESPRAFFLQTRRQPPIQIGKEKMS